MATVKLATGRPIINHPHYEDAGIRLGNIFDRFAHFQPAHAEREPSRSILYTVDVALLLSMLPCVTYKLIMSLLKIAGVTDNIDQAVPFMR